MPATAASAAAHGAPTRPLDLADPAERLRTYMLMRGALDDQLVIGFISGRYYGVVEAEIRPLYGVLGVTFARYRKRPDGGYDGATYEVPFFTDLQTGHVMERWRNPYTGEDVDVPQTAYPPAAIVIDPDMRMRAPKSPLGLASSDRVLASMVSGPDVWVTEETTSTLTLPGVSKLIRYSELVTLHALRSDLEKPGTTQVPCQTSFTSVVSWRPWLKMGDRPGHLMGNGSGRYGLPMRELPAAWREAAAHYRPEVLSDPAAALAALLAD